MEIPDSQKIFLEGLDQELAKESVRIFTTEEAKFLHRYRASYLLTETSGAVPAEQTSKFNELIQRMKDKYAVGETIVIRNDEFLPESWEISSIDEQVGVMQVKKDGRIGTTTFEEVDLMNSSEKFKN